MRKTLTSLLTFIAFSFTGYSVVLNLGDAQDYNAVVFGDHIATQADTEGRLAVGGNASLPGSYSVGHSVIGPQNPQSDGTRDDLVVKGNLTLQTGYVTVNYGNVKVGGSITGDGQITQLSSNTTTSEVTNLETDIFNFEQVESLVRNYSSLWSGLETTGTITTPTTQYPSLTLTGTSTTLNVFNLTASEWTTSSRYIDVPVDSTVIINISGTTVTTGTGGNVFFGNSEQQLDASNYRDNVIYNLYEATTVESSHLSWEGSVFAADATLTTSGGSINGQAFFDNVNQENSFEFHNFSVLAENAPVPEPSQAAALLGAVALAMAVRRRRQ
jgi:choice-of-anchor A domain-containing protein